MDTDLDALHEIESNQDVTRYLYSEPPSSREETRQVLERRMVAIDDKGDALLLAAFWADTHTLVGDFSLQRTSREHSQGEIGFVLHPAHQGNG